jgi:hypothetical protein
MAQSHAHSFHVALRHGFIENPMSDDEIAEDIFAHRHDREYLSQKIHDRVFGL